MYKYLLHHDKIAMVIDMKRKLLITLLTLTCTLCLIQDVYTVRAEHSSIRIEDKQLKGVDNLMIVAHPDDETIWGGEHLMKEKYFVVCITNGSNLKRSTEFRNVMDSIHTPSLMLHYPDKTNGKRDNWNSTSSAIHKDLEYIIHRKKWKKIVTHNPKGEYGHIHHKKTSRFVTSIYLNMEHKPNFYYFGKYSKKSNIHQFDSAPHISNEDLMKKVDMMKLYPSQRSVDKKLRHMYQYENWIPYQDWK